MASYTFNTTPQQESLLSWIVARHNAERDLHLTNQEYITLRVPDLFQPYVEAYKAHLESQIVSKFAGASVQTQAQILALLGVS